MNWPRRSLWLLALVLFAVANVPWHLDDYDQAKQAYTSYEMIHGGAWLIQHSPKGEMATKPPLAGWISAALYLPLRSWDAAWRLPSFIAALLLFGLLLREGGWLAGAAFAFNGFSPRLATLVRTDMLLALGMFLIGWRIYQKVRDRTPWTNADRWFIFACALASMLTKGPILYAFLLPGLLAFWIITRRAEAPNSAWCGWWPWLLPLTGFALWAGLGMASNPEFYQRVIVQEFLGRFETGENAVHDAKPIYLYVTKLLAMFAPWMWLLLAAPFVPALRRKIGARPELLWLICWVVGGLIVMSLVPSKRADRIFPLLPPACLLISALFAHEPGTPLLWRRLAQLGALVAMLGTFIYTGFDIAGDVRNDATALEKFGARARAYAEVHGQKLTVVRSNDQGLVLYTHELQTTDDKLVSRSWAEGRISAAVIPKSAWIKYRARFAGGRVVLECPRTPDTFSEYVFLVRE